MFVKIAAKRVGRDLAQGRLFLVFTFAVSIRPCPGAVYAGRAVCETTVPTAPVCTGCRILLARNSTSDFPDNFPNLETVAFFGTALMLLLLQQAINVFDYSSRSLGALCTSLLHLGGDGKLRNRVALSGMLSNPVGAYCVSLKTFLLAL
ncbi:hypothetical protein Tco_0951684 [Tanacetum coccineum]|uniref:Uncharacterized protein n=1 Tax=Tanacetum coccineum TaxID=301880 RepID=A0ABQ5E1K2_9ASTR